MLTLLHALDDKRRLEILTALKNRSLYGQEIVAITGLSAATISHNERTRRRGLISIEKQGSNCSTTSTPNGLPKWRS
jgi:DNA-binding transcriptional ArsR family regulator